MLGSRLDTRWRRKGNSYFLHAVVAAADRNGASSKSHICVGCSGCRFSNLCARRCGHRPYKAWYRLIPSNTGKAVSHGDTVRATEVGVRPWYAGMLTLSAQCVVSRRLLSSTNHLVVEMYD